MRQRRSSGIKWGVGLVFLGSVVSVASQTDRSTSGMPKLPEGGEALLPAGGLGAFELFGQKDRGRVEPITVTGQPFTSAFRVSTLSVPTNPWELQLGTWLKHPVREGDVLVVQFWLRSVRGQAETGEARTLVGFATGGPEWASSMREAISIPRTWKAFSFPFVARHTTPVDRSILTFEMGTGTQVFEIADISLTNFGTRRGVRELPRTRNDYPGQELDAPWRKAAKERIERLRKGPMTVSVVDSRGRPVAGARVGVRMVRHGFPFGTAVAADTLVNPGADSDRYRLTFLEHFNSGPIENHLKWPFWESWARQDGDRAVDWMVRHEFRLPISGPLVWGGWTNLPDDLKGLAGNPTALDQRVRNHIRSITGVYGDRIKEWEVINEPYAQNDLWRILGEDHMAEYFREARRARPKAHLTINDYPPLDYAGLGEGHLKAYDRMIARLMEQKAPVDGIGFQCHFGSAVVPPERLLKALDHFAKYGVPISITEFDMDTTDEDLQRRYLRDFYTAAFSHPAVDTIIMWGFWEGKHWMPNAALWRNDWTLKPNGQAFLDLVKGEWWTRANLATNARGRAQVSAFFGEYEVTVETPRGQRQVFLVPFAKGQGPITLRLDGKPPVVPQWLRERRRLAAQIRAEDARGRVILGGPSALFTEPKWATVTPVTSGARSDTDQAFSVTAVPPQPWDAQALSVTTGAIRPGQRVVLSWWARAVEGSPGRVQAVLQTGAPSYTGLTELEFRPGPTWRRYQMEWIAKDGYDAGQLLLVFRLGLQVQRIELSGVEGRAMPTPSTQSG